MKWNKLGLVFSASQLNLSWAQISALTPTPFVLNDDVVRVYAGFRDSEGVSRIGYADLNAHNPQEVLGVSENPVLDVGRAGCFDDNGVILGDVIRVDDKIRMYYVGFQIVKNVKFLAFTGLAESSDNGETFQRISEAPVLDRTHGASTIRAIHTIMFDDGVWKAWYAVGDDWQEINDIDYPKYNIWYTESDDGIQFSKPGVLCIDNEGAEYRIGRPSAYKTEQGYLMFYTKGSTSGEDYFPGVAFSGDGINWTRDDSKLGLTLSESGFDSRHLCYPRLFSAQGKTYAVYNGNNMGLDGFGLAELVEW